MLLIEDGGGEYIPTRNCKECSVDCMQMAGSHAHQCAPSVALILVGMAHLQAAGHLSFHPGEVTGTLIDMACTKLSSFRDFELANMLRAVGEIGLSKDSLGGAPGRLLAAIDAQPAIVECIMNCRSQSAFIGAFSATITLEVWQLTLNLETVKPVRRQ